MGMSASQSRLLSLTARMSDLEFEAQSISNSKIRLADSSADASKNYEDALNKEKITVMSGDASTYVDATAYNLTTYAAVSSTDKQRFLVDSSERLLVTTKVGEAYDSSQNQGSQSYYIKNTLGYKTVGDYLKATLGYSTEAEATASGLTYDAKQVAYNSNLFSGKEDFLNSLGYTSNPENDPNAPNLKNDSGATSYYSNTFDKIAENGYNCPGDSNMSDSEWLYNQLSNGNVYLEEFAKNSGADGKGAWDKVSWSSGDTTMKTASDNAETAKAEAAYETTMARIQSQDKRFDLQLTQINTEHQAIQTEIDSVKKVIDKNIDSSFKIFNA